MKTLKRLSALAFSVAALFTSTSPSVHAADGKPDPTTPVTLVVPYSPGSGPDLIARLIAPRLGEKWHRAVVVENKTGASGNIGTDYVSKAAPDGSTLLLAVNTITITPSLYRQTATDISRDLTPVTKLAVASFGLAVNSRLPVTDVAGLIAYAKANPGKLNYGSPGNGTPHHLAMELLKAGAHIDLTHIPYRGLSGGLTDLLGDHVQTMFSAIPSLIPYANGERLRLIAVTGTTRSPLTPQTPTFREQNIHYMDGIDAWFAVYAPKNTSKSVTTKLNLDIGAAINLPDVRKQLASQGIMVETSTPGELAALTISDSARWKKVITDFKITAD